MAVIGDGDGNEEPAESGRVERAPMLKFQNTQEDGWAANAKAVQEANKTKLDKLKAVLRAYWKRKKWTIPLTIVILIGAVLGIPVSRYATLGLFVKHTVDVTVVDSITDKPVSGVTVKVASKTATTNAEGVAALSIPVGPHEVSISKQYYKPNTTKLVVSLLQSGTALQIRFTATGRQVPIIITSKITGKALAGVSVDLLGTDTKTDQDGKAIIVLPTTSLTRKAQLSLTGYNTASVTIQVTNQTVTANDFSLMPTGKIYFLADAGGVVNVVESNLDGSDLQTVLTGTGEETQATTQLSASTDWNYLVLIAKRQNNQEGVYLIDTSDNNVTDIDTGNNTKTFTPVGWSGDTFVYESVDTSVSSWQSGGQVLKSYDATTGKLYNIDENEGDGTSSSDYATSSFSGIYIFGSQLVYAKNWSASAASELTGKNTSIFSVNASGSNKQDLQDFPVPATSQSYAAKLVAYEPQALYIGVPNTTGTTSYYTYSSGKVTPNSITDSTFNQQYPNYLVSPSGNQTFWADGQSSQGALSVGNASATNQNQIAKFSDYAPYGWYTDNYVLVSENDNELYIMPATGSELPVKVGNYYESMLNNSGNGGGYGG